MSIIAILPSAILICGLKTSVEQLIAVACAAGRRIHYQQPATHCSSHGIFHRSRPLLIVGRRLWNRPVSVRLTTGIGVTRIEFGAPTHMLTTTVRRMLRLCRRWLPYLSICAEPRPYPLLPVRYAGRFARTWGLPRANSRVHLCLCSDFPEPGRHAAATQAAGQLSAALRSSQNHHFTTIQRKSGIASPTAVQSKANRCTCISPQYGAPAQRQHGRNTAEDRSPIVVHELANDHGGRAMTDPGRVEDTVDHRGRWINWVAFLCFMWSNR